MLQGDGDDGVHAVLCAYGFFYGGLVRAVGSRVAGQGGGVLERLYFCIEGRK